VEVAVEAIHQHFTAWTPIVIPSKDGEARADVGSHKGWKSCKQPKNTEGSSESFFFVVISKFDMTIVLKKKLSTMTYNDHSLCLAVCPKMLQESPA